MSNNTKMGVYIDPKTNKEVSFNFWLDLSVKNKMKFVAGVTDTVIGDNYYSFLKDLIFDFEIIEIFTDVDISDISESTDTITSIEHFINSTKIVDIVKANVRDGLIDELMRAVEDNLEYRTGVHRNQLNDSISHLVNTIEKKMVDNINVDDISNLSKLLSNIDGELSIDKIAKACANSPEFIRTLANNYKEKEYDDKFTKMVKAIDSEIIKNNKNRK